MRSRENKIINIPLEGMSQSEDEYSSSRPLWLVENMRRRGSTLRKRPGLNGVTGSVVDNNMPLLGDNSTSIAEPTSFLGAIGAEHPVVGATHGAVFTYRNPEASSRAIFSGRFSTCRPVKGFPGFTGGENDALGFSANSPPSCAVDHDGNVFIAQPEEDDGELFLQIVSSSGVVLWQSDINLTAGLRAKAIAVTEPTGSDKQFILVYQDGGSTTLTGMAFSVDTFGVVTVETSATSVATLNASTNDWDITPIETSGTQRWAIFYQSTATLATVTRRTIALANAGAHSETITDGRPLSCWGDLRTNYLWYSWQVSGNVDYKIIDPGTSTILTQTSIVAVANTMSAALFGALYDHVNGYADTSNAMLLIRHYDSSNDIVNTYYGTTDDTGSVGTLTILRHVAPVCPPDSYNRAWCYITPKVSQTQGLARYALIRFADSHVQAAGNHPVTVELATPTFEAHDAAAVQSMKTIWKIGTGGSSYSFPWVRVLTKQTDGLTSVVRGQTVIYQYEGTEHVPQTATQEAGGGLVIGGQPTELFGQPSAAAFSSPSILAQEFVGCFEIGFLHPPAVSATATAGSISPGTRSYKAVFEWADSRGRRHRSAPSLPITVTNAAASGQTLKISTIHATQRKPQYFDIGIMVYVYRTVDGGNTYHKLSKYGEAYTGSHVTATDDQADSDIEDNEVLYTDGGILPNDLAPSCRFFCASESRLWCGGLWERNIIQCSKEIIPEEPIQFTEDFSHQVVLPASCTGLAYLDGTVVAFTEGSILTVSGAGPDDRGSGFFSPPRVVCDGIGCIDYRSVTTTPKGIIFLSRLGFYLLPRGFGVPIFIGEDVREEVDSLPDCVGSGFVSGPADSLARFAMTSSGGTSFSVVLSYDVDRGSWFKDILTNQFWTFSALGAWPRGFAFGRSSLETGSVCILVDDTSETDDIDSDQYVKQRFKTPWIAPFGPGGDGAINKLLISMRAPDAMQLSVRVNYEDGTTQTGIWEITDNTDPVLYRQMDLSKPRGTRWQIDCSTTGQSGVASGFARAGAGARFLGLTLEHESSGGVRRMADGERV